MNDLNDISTLFYDTYMNMVADALLTDPFTLFIASLLSNFVTLFLFLFILLFPLFFVAKLFKF